MKKLSLLIILIGFFAFLYPQVNKKNFNDKNVGKKSGLQLPSGWEMRFDRSNATKNDVKLVKEGEYYHFTSDPVGAAIYYNPKNKEMGEYKIEADFRQLKPSAHPEAYGVFLAGTNLQKENQYYLYFLVRQDGKYLIKKRIGNDTKLVVKWTADKNVNAENKKGETINKLSVIVGKKDVIFSANGKKLVSLSKKDLGGTDGIVGMRINHNLDIKVSSLNIKKM